MTDDVPTGDLPAAAASPAEAAAKPFPKILPSIGWILFYFIFLQGGCLAITTGLVLGWDKVGDQRAIFDNPVVILRAVAVAAFIQLIAIAIYLRGQNRMNRIGLSHFGNMKFWRVVVLALGAMLAAMLFNAAYANYVIPGIKMQGDYAQILAKLEMTPENITIGIFVVAIAAPVVEELLFRGLLQRALTKQLPIWAAIVTSSLAFSLMHGQYYAIPGLMSLSIAFGYVYHRTGSLLTNILLHMANNTVTLVMLSQLKS